MSNGPNVSDLKSGVEELAVAVNELETMAASISQRQPGRDGFGVNIVLEICSQIGSQGAENPLSQVTAATGQCGEPLDKLERYRDYEREARYCKEASMHVAELCGMAQEFAIHMHGRIMKLSNRASARDAGRWSRDDETRFWRDRNTFNSIASDYTSVPRIRDLGRSSEPWREETQADRALKDFLELCQKIRAHQRNIVYRLEMMAEEMARKYESR